MRLFSCFFSAAWCALTLCSSGAAFAQGSQRAVESYPTRPIRLVVPFAPGGSSDTITRQIGPKLGEQLGHQVVLDNRSGGNGALGTQIVARAVPDGYTVVHERLTAIGFDVVTSTPEAFARYIQSEVVKWRQLAKEMGLKPE